MAESKITIGADPELIEALKRLARALESADLDPKPRPTTIPDPYPWWSPPPFTAPAPPYPGYPLVWCGTTEGIVGQLWNESEKP